ncbi:MAG: TetR/AcrR family transcriptional regulator [Treponemataceae bacterium]|nr:TetR/AcrR family transcriptional regulator [Spirochaetales bacterium]MDY6031878.1 TetR/AcrR family transcriptional regulator [Treponemataceae bacterium]
MNAGIREFADKGLTGASLNKIAKDAGLSVGVIYKYYEDKNSLFLACVHFGLEALTDLLSQVISHEDDFELCVKKIVNTVIQTSIDGSEINRMYNTISSREANIFAKELANEIEGVSAKVYKGLFEKAQKEEKWIKNADPAYFAFFFDSILMMIQFSYGCDYYHERLKLYCGEDAFENNEKMADQLTKFLLNAMKN